MVDSNLTLINSINASYNGVSISNGSLDLQQKKEIEIIGKFNTQFDTSEKQLNKFFTNVNFFKENKIDLQGVLLHDFYLKVGKNYKIIDYNYESSGNISQSKVFLKKIFKTDL